MSQLKIIKIKNIDSKISKKNNEYIRLTLIAHLDNKEEIELKTNINLLQTTEIESKLPNAVFEIDMNNKEEIEFQSGTYEGKNYNYYELQARVLVRNKLIPFVDIVGEKLKMITERAKIKAAEIKKEHDDKYQQTYSGIDHLVKTINPDNMTYKIEEDMERP